MRTDYSNDRFLVVLFMLNVLITGSISAHSPEDSASPADEKQNAFPVYNVTKYGAVGDSSTLNSAAIQKAIDVATVNGGGTVYFPPGNYLTGTLRLRDNITLYLENGCTIWGSNNMEDYDEEQKHLIYAEKASNIVIGGHGSINGNGPAFWDNGRLQRWYRGEYDLRRTSDMIRFDSCSNIVLENVGIDYGAFWNIGFGNCSQITIHSISMRNGVYEDDGPNTDGINLWDCQKVQISDCDIITGDDCIVVLGKSRDVTITNCKLQTSETAIMISGVRNLAISNITIHDSGCGIGFRVWNDIVVDGVVIDNIVMDVTDRFKGGGTAIYMWSFPLYVETSIPEDTPLPPPGTINNVTISNVVASANGLVCVNGAENGYIKGLSLNNIKFFMYGGKRSEFNDNPPYPYPIYGFHHASPYSLFFRHVDGLKLNNVGLEWNTPEKPEWGSAIRCWKVNNLEINGFAGRQALQSDKATIELKEVDGAYIRNCIASLDSGSFLEIDEATRNVTLTGNDFSRCQNKYSLGPDIDKNVVFESCNRDPGR